MAEQSKTAAKAKTATKPDEAGVKPVKEVKAAPAAKKPARPKTEAAPVKQAAPAPAAAAEVKKEAPAAALKKEVAARTDSLPGVSLKVKRVLFVATESTPFAGTGGLGEVVGSLPRELNAAGEGVEARVIMPLYECVPAEWRKKMEFICHINVPLSWRNQYCGLFKLKYNGVVYYFVDNEYYFKRPNLYGYYDDGERFAFFSRAAIELIPYLDFKPDILHCHDWQTALVPVYYKLYYMYREGFGGIKNIFTIHNIEYQGKYGREIIEDVFGISRSEYFSVEHDGCINLLKGAIDYCDALSTVSPSYAGELMNPFFAHGLDGVIKKSSYKLRGILNGVDEKSYNPQTNPALFAPFSAEDFSGKAVNKAELQKMLGLPVNDKVAVMALITRLVSHKGLDLVRKVMDEILRSEIQVIVLGKGDPDYESFFMHMQKLYSQKMCSVIAFNRDLSHKLYAAADMFLMPSKTEPCGLSQMMACRYGTVPIVRATGGLRDSIKDCGNGDNGNGFVFERYDENDMLGAVRRALGLYYDYPDKWQALRGRAIKSDFSWRASAHEYAKFYRED